MKPSDLKPSEIAPYFQEYINLVPNFDLVKALICYKKSTLALLESLSEEQLNYKYQVDKWTIKEVIMHILDNERVFNYRALCFARNDTTELPGYDHNKYVDESYANAKNKQQIIEEYITQRNASIMFFKNMDAKMLLQIGIAGGNTMSVRAIGFLLSGHEIHHINVLKEKYKLG